MHTCTHKTSLSLPRMTTPSPSPSPSPFGSVTIASTTNWPSLSSLLELGVCPNRRYGAFMGTTYKLSGASKCYTLDTLKECRGGEMCNLEYCLTSTGASCVWDPEGIHYTCLGNQEAAETCVPCEWGDTQALGCDALAVSALSGNAQLKTDGLTTACLGPDGSMNCRFVAADRVQSASVLAMAGSLTFGGLLPSDLEAAFVQNAFFFAGAPSVGAGGDAALPGVCDPSSNVIVEGGACETKLTTDPCDGVGSVGDPFFHYTCEPTCIQVAWPDANQEACCKQMAKDADLALPGSGEDPSLACAPTWCGLDPAGACADVVRKWCTVTTGCGRHAFLDPSNTDPDTAFCHEWYNGVMADAAGLGALQLGADPSTISSLSSVSTSQLQLAMASFLPKYEALVDVVGQFCASPAGYASGDCACWNYKAACESSGGACLVTVPNTAGSADGTTPTSNVPLRANLHCMAGTPSTQRFLSAAATLQAVGVSTFSNGFHLGSASSICSPSVDPTTGATPVGSPVGPAGPSGPASVIPMPAHCYVPACQFGAACTFVDPLQLSLPCPDVCFLEASNVKVDIGNLNAPAMWIGDNTVRCTFDKPSLLPNEFVVLDPLNPSNTVSGAVQMCFAALARTISSVEASLTVLNIGSDSAWPAMAALPVRLLTTFGPFFQFLGPNASPDGSQWEATLSNAASVTVPFRIDASVLDEANLDEPYEAYLVLQDPRGLSADRLVELDIHIQDDAIALPACTLLYETPTSASASASAAPQRLRHHDADYFVVEDDASECRRHRPSQSRWWRSVLLWLSVAAALFLIVYSIAWLVRASAASASAVGGAFATTPTMSTTSRPSSSSTAVLDRWRRV